MKNFYAARAENERKPQREDNREAIPGASIEKSVSAIEEIADSMWHHLIVDGGQLKTTVCNVCSLSPAKST